MASGTNGLGESRWLAPLQAVDTEGALAAYSETEEEDAATQLFDTMMGEPKWLVQITRFDRRLMDTAQLVSETESGTLVRTETLVWRGGMDNWLPIEQVAALPSVRPPATAPQQRATVDRRLSLTPLNGVLASTAVVLLSAALTIAALSLGGVFDNSNAVRARSRSVSHATATSQEKARLSTAHRLAHVSAARDHARSE